MTHDSLVCGSTCVTFKFKKISVESATFFTVDSYSLLILDCGKESNTLEPFS